MPAQPGSQPSTEQYVLDNAAPETARRFTGLSTVFDPGTFRILAERGVTPGWRCLEVGAGPGTAAAWLGERVGPTGYVLATDIDPRFAEELRRPNIEVRKHDISADSLPDAAFDLIHARLVLIHLPTRDEVLRRMAFALRPRGWLVIEDYDSYATMTDPEFEGVLKARQAIFRVMESRCVDLRYGRKIAARMEASGLREVGAEARIFRWQGGSPGAGIHSANIQQMRESLLASGLVNEAELEADLARLNDPQCSFVSPVMWAAWGRRSI